VAGEDLLERVVESHVSDALQRQLVRLHGRELAPEAFLELLDAGVAKLAGGMR
jgi:hypothetical protein